MTRIHLGISTCPNDTFAFHGILSGELATDGLDYEVELLDVEELNRRLFAGDFDVAKASFHAALSLAEEIVVLPSGSALGFGNGPLLLARGDIQSRPPQGEPCVLCPGEHTTATLLYRLFHSEGGEPRQVIFSEIMPSLVAGDADYGVCIHEGRFTWEEQGLHFVEDLGMTWERTMQAPLPLGGIVARRKLGRETLEAVQRAVRASIEYGHTHREEALITMRRHAQELTDEVLFAHVDLYVNEQTLDLGSTGRRALRVLAERAGMTALDVFECTP